MLLGPRNTVGLRMQGPAGQPALHRMAQQECVFPEGNLEGAGFKGHPYGSFRRRRPEGCMHPSSKNTLGRGLERGEPP